MNEIERAKKNCMQTGNYARSLGKAPAKGRAKGKGVGAIRASISHPLKEDNKPSPKGSK